MNTSLIIKYQTNYIKKIHQYSNSEGVLDLLSTYETRKPLTWACDVGQWVDM